MKAMVKRSKDVIMFVFVLMQNNCHKSIELNKRYKESDSLEKGIKGFVFISWRVDCVTLSIEVNKKFD